MQGISLEFSWDNNMGISCAKSFSESLGASIKNVRSEDIGQFCGQTVLEMRMKGKGV